MNTEQRILAARCRGLRSLRGTAMIASVAIGVTAVHAATAQPAAHSGSGSLIDGARAAAVTLLETHGQTVAEQNGQGGDAGVPKPKIWNKRP